MFTQKKTGLRDSVKSANIFKKELLFHAYNNIYLLDIICYNVITFF